MTKTEFNKLQQEIETSITDRTQIVSFHPGRIELNMHGQLWIISCNKYDFSITKGIPAIVTVKDITKKYTIALTKMEFMTLHFIVYTLWMKIYYQEYCAPTQEFM